jgi:uncharacterized protein
MHLTLHLTNRCNLACRYCYAAAGREDMTLETARQAILRCAQGPQSGIIFFGGEPLLRKDLIGEIIRWCEQHEPGRFHYKVTTNGTLLDDEFLEEADRWGMQVAISHDGIREVHDRFRVRPDGAGTFDTLLPKLQMLLRRQPYAPVMMTVNPECVDRYAESAIWLQSKGVQYLIASLNYAGPWTNGALRLLRKEYRKLESWHTQNYRRERKMYFSPFDKRIASHIFADRGSSCRLGRRQISVAPDGRLYPCVQFVGRESYSIGTAEHGIDEGKREAIYAMNEQDKPQCAGCALVGRCHNKCGCLNIQTTGCLTSVPAVLCEHERIAFPIADRLAERLFKERDAMFIQRHYNPAFPIFSFLEDLAV